MKRLAVMTVGRTHSGKTTFARALERQLNHSVVVDQDNHAEFINTHYKALLPKQGANTIKYAITQTVVDYVMSQTNFHLILCNANRSRKGRLDLLSKFHSRDFTSALVHFSIPDEILKARVTESNRSTIVFRTASSFAEVLARQQAETEDDMVVPTEGEADYYFNIKSSDEVQAVIEKIIKFAL